MAMDTFEEYEKINTTRITEVPIIIIGITAFLSILIISGAIFALYLFRQKTRQYSLEIKDQILIKTRRDIYCSTEEICSDQLGLQWILSKSNIKRFSAPALNTENTAYTALKSVGHDTLISNVNTENAAYTGLHSVRQNTSTNNINIENAAFIALKSVRQDTSTNKAKTKNSGYTAVKLVRQDISKNKVDINASIETESKYHCLDFTSKSNEKSFKDGNEYNNTKQKVTDLVYEEPWEEETSKFQRAFSQIRQGMVHRGRSIRKSILRRQSRIHGNYAYNVTELNHENFVYDSPKAENVKEGFTKNVIERKEMLNKEDAMDGVSQCTLRNKVNRQSKCAQQETRRSSVKLKFQKMFSLKTFKTPASFEQSNNTSSPDDCA